MCRREEGRVREIYISVLGISNLRTHFTTCECRGDGEIQRGMTSNNHPRDAFNSAASSRSTSATPSSTARPRNRRLISVTDDDEDGLGGRSSAASPRAESPGLLGTAAVSATSSRSRNARDIPSAYSSKTGSPSQSRFPSRAPSRNMNRQDSYGVTGSPQRNNANKNNAGNFSDFWGSSWSSLQELASVVLGGADDQNGGGDAKSTTTSKSASGNHQRRKPSKSNFAYAGQSSNRSSPLPSSWGPSNFLNSRLATGSVEDRQAMVQAQKRQALLQGSGDVTIDRRGNHKRKDSTDRHQSSAVMDSDENESDALVYIHHVTPTDSVTGVSIKYGCQPTVLRKANGFWPSDSIQARNSVLLPVDSCTLKGRRIPPEQLTDQQNNVKRGADVDSFNIYEDDTSLNTAVDSSSTLDRGDATPRGSEASSRKGSKPAPSWEHECWIQIEGFVEPIEIGRVPRRTLGFFPRARRKSNAQFEPYSDTVDSPSYDNNINSNKPSSAQRASSSSQNNTSFHLPSSRSSSSSRSQNQATSSTSNSQPIYTRHRRQRSSLVLSGPPGVGTLGRNVNTPGPAPDKLNSFITTHLPNLSLPPPPRPASNPSHNSVPRASIDSSSTVTSNNSTGLENVGGAIEGWVRKMATRAKTGISELQQPGNGQASPHGLGGMGDLIELDDALEGRSNVQLLSTEQSNAQFPAIRRMPDARYNTNLSSSSSAALSSSMDKVRGRTLGLNSGGVGENERAKDD